MPGRSKERKGAIAMINAAFRNGEILDLNSLREIYCLAGLSPNTVSNLREGDILREFAVVGTDVLVPTTLGTHGRKRIYYIPEAVQKRTEEDDQLL